MHPMRNSMRRFLSPGYLQQLFNHVHRAYTTHKRQVHIILIHLVALIVTCVIVFANNRFTLFLGYDGAHLRSIIQQQHDWMPFGLYFTSHPLEALGNIFNHRNTRLMLGMLLASAPFDGDVNPIMAYSLSSVEIFLSMIIMSFMLRLRFSVMLLAAWSTTLLTMPFIYPPAWYPITTLIPYHIEVVSAYCLILGLFYRIGKGSHFLSAGFALMIFGITTVIVAAHPLWVLLAIPVLALLVFTFVVTSTNRREAFTKGIVIIGLFIISLMGLLPFFGGNLLYSVAAFFSDELSLGGRDHLSFTSILFHAYTGDGYFGPYIFGLSLLGALYTYFSGKNSNFRKLAAAVIVAQIVILLSVGLIRYILTRYRGPTVLYFEFFLWPFYFVFAAAGVLILLRMGIGLLRRVFYQDANDRIVNLAGIVGGHRHLLVLLLPLMVIVASFSNIDNDSPYSWTFPAQENDIVRTLKAEIALTPGTNAEFRGIVATFTGFMGNSEGVSWSNLQSNDGVHLVSTGNDHRAMGFWQYNIPTLFEYNQMMTPPYYLMTTRLLARPQDLQERNVILLTKLNPGYLKSLGVRFVVTDFLVDSLTLRQTLRWNDLGDFVYLYELDQPNLGNYSPTMILLANSAVDTLAYIAEEDFDFANNVVVESALPVDLVKASSSSIHMSRDGMRVSAESSGTSLLILPLQISHCLELRIVKNDKPDFTPRLMRVNLTQAGLLFSGSIEVHIRFAYGPFTNSFCRIEDTRDMIRLDISNRDKVVPPPIKDLSVRQVFGEWFEIDVKSTSSSVENHIDESTYSGELAVDGNHDTYWSTPIRDGPQREYLIADLGGVYQVGRVQWLGRHGFPQLTPNTVTIELSLDGINWETVIAEQKYSVQDRVWAEAHFNPQWAQYLRLSSQARAYQGNDYYLQIAELKVEAYDQFKGIPSNGVVELNWTVPGDRGVVSKAFEYEIRWATQPIRNETDWENATVIMGTPKPAAAGIREPLIVRLDNVADETQVYFAIRARHKVGDQQMSELVGSTPIVILDITSTKLVEKGYKGFNIVAYGGEFYALAQTLGEVDLTKFSREELGKYQAFCAESSQCVIASSLEEVKNLID